MTDNEYKKPTAYALRKREKEERVLLKAAAEERFRLALQKKEASNTEGGIEFVEEFMGDVILGTQKHCDTVSKGGNPPFWYKPFLQIKPELIADLCLRTIADAAGQGWKYGKYVEFAGKAFAALYVQQMVDGNAERRKRFEHYETQLKKNQGSQIRRVEIYWKYAEEKLGFTYKSLKKDPNNPHEKERGWTVNNCRIVGQAMLNIILAGTDFAEIEKLKKDGDNKKSRYITLRNVMAKVLEEKNLKLEERSYWYGPMMHTPNEWADPDSHGPYADDAVNHTIKFIRNMQPPQEAQYTDLVAKRHLSEVHEAVDQIGAVPLDVNFYVYMAVKWAWKTGRHTDVNEFPALIRVPVPDRIPDEEFKKLDLADQIVEASEREDVIKFNNSTLGNKTNLQRHLALAKRMAVRQRLAQIDGFSLPANCDYRGRVYPIPDFNYQKADYMRSLFLFHNKTEVDEFTVGDIRIQLTNSWGNGEDKGTQSQLEKWARDNEAMILDVGRDFRKHFDIWSKADAPFQFLAACREMYKYRKHGEGYLTGLPVARDATQSGVQHYALALRHIEDARKVNLVDWAENDPTPNDFYYECLVEAKKLIQQSLDDNLNDQQNNPVTPDDEAEYSAHLLLEKQLREAKDEDGLLEEKRRWKKTAAAAKFKRDTAILSAQQVQAWYDGPYLPYNRKVIKRNCMTYCYSSRQYGFSKQLRKDWLDELSRLQRDPDHPLKEHPFGKDKGFAVSTFLGGIHEAAIAKIITSASTGMDFICGLTRLLAKHNCHLTFLNPIGFPMHQHYCETKREHQKLPMYERGINTERFAGKLNPENNVNFRSDTESVDVESSVDACSPNIIHSMDSCHLMKVVLRCKQRGLNDLMLVHDSFATTVGNVPKMDALIKFELAELYKDFNLYQTLLDQNVPKMRQGLGWKAWAEAQVDDKPDKRDPDKTLLSADDKRRRFLRQMLDRFTDEILDKIPEDDADNFWWHVWDGISHRLERDDIDNLTLEGGEVSPELIADIAGELFDRDSIPEVPLQGQLDLEVVKRSQNSFR